MIAAGYCLYGSSTQIVLCIGGKVVNGYTLDSNLGEFVLTHPDMRVKPKGQLIYSINEGNSSLWDKAISTYVDTRKNPGEGKKVYSLRYVGSMVADVHRTIIYGGIFLYPKDSKNKSGKLRLLYEAAPMAYIIEGAGGMAITGNGRILDHQPTKIHERVPVILGSSEEVKEVQKLYEEFKC
jgi:fructose-1,6-bisphosphatase I